LSYPQIDDIIQFNRLQEILEAEEFAVDPCLWAVICCTKCRNDWFLPNFVFANDCHYTFSWATTTLQSTSYWLS